MDGSTKFVFPAAGFQHTLLKKEFTPEGMLFGHNTLYFNLDNPTPLQKAVRQGVRGQVQGLPALGGRPRLLRDAGLPAGVEAAYKAKNAWPGQDDVIRAMEGVKVESLGGPGHMRKDHIAEQTFYQGLTTHKNRLRLRDDRRRRPECTRTSCKSRRERTSGNGSRRRKSSSSRA